MNNHQDYRIVEPNKFTLENQISNNHFYTKSLYFDDEKLNDFK